jgi:hypothetical protein
MHVDFPVELKHIDVVLFRFAKSHIDPVLKPVRAASKAAALQPSTSVAAQAGVAPKIGDAHRTDNRTLGAAPHPAKP